MAWLGEVVCSRHSFLSFQAPGKMADAIRLAIDGELWKEVAQMIGRPVQGIEQELELIVAHRNAIAHESDISPVPPYDQNDIKIEDVTGALEFMEGVVSVIRSFLNGAG